MMGMDSCRRTALVTCHLVSWSRITTVSTIAANRPNRRDLGPADSTLGMGASIVGELGDGFHAAVAEFRVSGVRTDGRPVVPAPHALRTVGFGNFHREVRLVGWTSDLFQLNLRHNEEARQVLFIGLQKAVHLRIGL